MEKLACFAKEQASLVFEKISMRGPVTCLMMQQSATRHTLLSELEWCVMPALVLDQTKIYMRENARIAYVSWTKMSEQCAVRYKNPPHQLIAADWKSSKLRDNVFARHTVQQLVPTVGEKVKALVWPAV